MIQATYCISWLVVVKFLVKKGEKKLNKNFPLLFVAWLDAKFLEKHQERTLFSLGKIHCFFDL